VIRIDVTTKQGLPARITSDGHAGSVVSGADPVCAAVSVLLKTFARTLLAEEGIRVDGSALRRGSFEVRILSVEPAACERFRGIAATVMQGLSDLATEYPKSVRLQAAEEAGNLVSGAGAPEG